MFASHANFSDGGDLILIGNMVPDGGTITSFGNLAPLLRGIVLVRPPALRLRLEHERIGHRLPAHDNKRVMLGPLLGKRTGSLGTALNKFVLSMISRKLGRVVAAARSGLP